MTTNNHTDEPIVVTPTMTEVGVTILNRCEADNWMPDRHEVVAAIYRAMRPLDPASIAEPSPEGL